MSEETDFLAWAMKEKKRELRQKKVDLFILRLKGKWLKLRRKSMGDRWGNLQARERANVAIGRIYSEINTIERRMKNEQRSN